MYFTSGSDRAFEQLMQGKPGFDHYDSGEAVTPEDCGTCRFYRPHWKYQFCVYAECPYQPGKLTAYDAVTFRVKGVENMAVFRVERNKGYTVMSNHHLRDKSLSLKAKGLLSLMLSLPEEWDYTTKGLARICKDGVDSICAGVRELEEHGYVIRQRVRNPNGQLGAIEYTILEQPRPPEPKPGKPERENPVLDNPEQASPVLGEPEQENPAQLNTKESSKDKSKKDLSSTEGSNPILSSPQTPRGSDRAGRDWMRERESYRELILENIEYDILIQNERMDRDRLDELVELMVDTVCSRRETIRIAGDDYPAEVVKSRFLKLNSSHIEYVLDRMRENTTYVRNIKKYLLAALYNAPATIDSYYASLVNHDLYGSGERPANKSQVEISGFGSSEKGNTKSSR